MAKTQAGKVYAQIVNGRCHLIFTSAELPEYNEHHIQVVDVTSNVPSIGNDWNGSGFVPHVKTTEEFAIDTRIAEQAALRVERQQIKLDVFVQQFVTMSPAQVVAYINSNGSTVASLREIVIKLALMQLSDAKEKFK